MIKAFALSALAATVAIAMGFGVAAAFATDDDPNGGVGLQVSVTASPAPSPVYVPSVPTGLSVSEARFPIALSGLDPFSYVEIFANSTPVLIASGYADASGAFQAVVALPPNLAVGDHSISATNTTSSGVKKTITIVKFAVASNGLLAEAGTASPGTVVGGSTSSNSSSSASTTAAADGAVTSETLTGTAAVVDLGPDPFSVGGQLYFGGVSSEANYATGVLFPALRSTVVVRNVTTSPVSAVASVAVSNLFGGAVAESRNIAIDNLAPGETRKVTIRTDNVGSWGGYNVALSVAVPQSDAAVTRGTTTFAFPLASLLVVLGALALATVLIWIAIRAGALPRRRRSSQTPQADWDAAEAH